VIDLLGWMDLNQLNVCSLNDTINY